MEGEGHRTPRWARSQFSSGRRDGARGIEQAMRSSTAWMFVLLGACGGPAAPAEEQGGEPTSGAEQAEERSVAWSEMTHEQKAEYMATVVVPRMRPLFQAFDAEEFAEFGCATCHGENAREVGF